MAFQSKTACLCSAWITFCLAGYAAAQLPVTQLRVLFPPAAHVGSTQAVEVLGQGPLDEIDRLIFSHPGLSANVVAGESNPLTNQTHPVFGKFTLSVASDVPPGFYEVWAIGRNGASSSRVLWVAPRPVVSLAQPGDDQSPGPQLDFDKIVLDRFAAAKVQRYVLPLSAGQQIRVTALDAKLDSRALTHLRILDPESRTVAAASQGIAGAVAEFAAKHSGSYTVEVRDAIYRGGDEFFYALWAEPAEGPRADPTAGPWNQPAQVAAALAPPPGQLSQARNITGSPIDRWIDEKFPLVTADSSTGSGPLQVTPPCLIAGTFTDAPDGQAFEFSVKKGESLAIDVISEQMGERTDPILSLSKVPAPSAAETGSGSDKTPGKLERILEQDDGPASGTPPFRIARFDPSVRLDAPADGVVRLVVRDQLATNAASAGGRFLLAIRPPRPTLSLVAAWASPTNNAAQARPIGNNLCLEGTAAVRVIVKRIDGLAGDVEVRCEGLPEGVSAAPILVPGDRDEGHLILVCQGKASAFAGPIKIVGRALNAAGQQAEAAAAELTWEPIPTWNALSHRMSQQLIVAVNDKDTFPISFEIGGSEPLTVARGSKLGLPIKVVRRDGGKDKLTFRAQNLPAKTTLAEVGIDGPASEGKGELVVAADAPLGEATFWFQVETKLKTRNNPQALQRAELERQQLEKLLAYPARADQKDAIAAALKAAQENEKKLKELTAEREQAVFLPTPTVRIKIVDKPS
ncbi:MAG: hypothetical protein ACTHOU_07010 [Aureliella sp.]